jgi:DNA polymerase
MSHSEFLKEMGITEWVARDLPKDAAPSMESNALPEKNTAISEPAQRISQGEWLFFGSQPQGDAQLLFNNIIRALGLASNEWSWRNPADPLNQITAPASGLPIVAFAFGGPVAQKITGEKDSLPQLRETVLALNTGNEEEVPVIASYDLSQAMNNPKEKALLWQDLLLAQSVLQNI